MIKGQVRLAPAALPLWYIILLDKGFRGSSLSLKGFIPPALRFPLVAFGVPAACCQEGFNVRRGMGGGTAPRF